MASRLSTSSIAPMRTATRINTLSSLKCSNVSWIQQKRHVAQTHLTKVAAGEERWAARAERIQKGEERHMWDILEERGYLKDVAGNPERIKEIMRTKRIGAYVGIDPTADSMHVGHIIPLMPLFWMWFHGYPAVTLIGGATARIGDPTGRLQSRENMSNSEVSKNITKIHYQLTRLWHNVVHLRDKYGYADDWAARHHLLNNSMWLQGLTIYDFMKRLARDTRLGPMLSRDTVKRKMEEGDGMSFAELMYPLFQGWDFWHLYNKLGVQMQIGGSDQYGNIISGIEALKTIRESEEAPHLKMPSEWQHEPMGFTVPLLTDAAGNKLGKSAGNAVWIDEFKTSSFELYGYFMRRSDDEIEKLLKLFTFMPMKTIQAVMAEHNQDPSKRVAQHTLAFEFVSLVHGSQKALQEAQQHKFRFGGELPKVMNVPSAESGIVTPNNAPRSDIQLPQSVMQLSPAKLLLAAGLAPSAAEGQRLVKAQGAYVAAQPGQKRGLVPGNLSWTPIKMWFPEETSKFLIDDKILILRKGKHNVRIVELVSDAEWKASGKTYPGQPYTGAVRTMKEQLRKEAEAEAGTDVSAAKLNKVLTKKVDDLKRTRVVNNPDIAFPSSLERRERQRGQGKDQKGDDDKGN